jgi:hypothetical protein
MNSRQLLGSNLKDKQVAIRVSFSSEYTIRVKLGRHHNKTNL